MKSEDIAAGAVLAMRRRVAATRTHWLLVSMVLTVVAVGLLAYWDERGRSQGGLEDLGEEQIAVARAVALAVGPELRGDDAKMPSSATEKLRQLERDGTRLLVAPPHGELATLEGVRAALPATTDHAVRISRDEAASLGLPARTAMMGSAPTPSGWRIAVVASAERQRDRDRAGLFRILFATAIAAGVVATFGGVALRRQRAQLELARELAIADVSRTKDAELERLSRAATMAALGSGVAHELSTPLGVIVGRAEQLLAKSVGDERATKAAQTILDQAEHVDRVVRGLLGLARGAPIALKEVEPRQLVREAAELVEHRFARANVHLVPAVSASVPSVRCEPLLFKHALVNLLLNACDASPAGSTVRLEVQADSAEVAFVVSDEGEGITAANAARAVEPFFTTKPVGQGTGLGLAIAHEIASSHRGELAIAPKSPRGTRASITIPAGGAHA